MIKKLQCINISTLDTKRLVMFYHETLGLPIVFEGYGNYDGATLGFGKDVTTICIWDEAKWGAYEGHPTFVFMSDGLDETYAELVAKGVSLAKPELMSWGGRELRLDDPDGNHIMILEDV
ncbi:VOC family protein [Breznakia sp. OttesenSCG-928-G09]|nr:VOC family protein [Breznakia sp. OttesenSCG-928-G09]